MRWWTPKPFGVSFISCEADVRAGGTYRFVFGHAASEQLMEFLGKYIEVTPHTRLVWTNDEGDESGAGHVKNWRPSTLGNSGLSPTSFRSPQAF